MEKGGLWLGLDVYARSVREKGRRVAWAVGPMGGGDGLTWERSKVARGGDNHGMGAAHGNKA